jgi:hypothetical protein
MTLSGDACAQSPRDQGFPGASHGLERRRDAPQCGVALVARWQRLGRASSAVPSAGGRQPGDDSIVRKTRPSAAPPPPDLGLCERRICANSDGDDVVVPSKMTESGLPQ